MDAAWCVRGWVVASQTLIIRAGPFHSNSFCPAIFFLPNFRVPTAASPITTFFCSASNLNKLVNFRWGKEKKKKKRSSFHGPPTLDQSLSSRREMIGWRPPNILDVKFAYVGRSFGYIIFTFLLACCAASSLIERQRKRRKAIRWRPKGNQWNIISFFFSFSATERVSSDWDRRKKGRHSSCCNPSLTRI